MLRVSEVLVQIQVCRFPTGCEIIIVADLLSFALFLIGA